MRYISYGNTISTVPYVITGDIPSFKNQSSDILMITGASTNHALASFNCLFSMVLADPYASYMYIDFGILDHERLKLFAHFDTINQIQKKMHSTGFIAYRKFRFSSFPKWMWIEGNEYTQHGYAWKVISHMDAAFAWKGITIWNDAGNVIVNGLFREMTNARVDGIYSPPSPGSQNRWTHPDCAKFLLNNKLIQHYNVFEPSCSSGFIISDWSHTDVVNKVLYPFYQCAFTQKCISPRKSNKENHRQDQSVLSALLNNLKTSRSMNYKYNFHPAFRIEYHNNTKQFEMVLDTILKKILYYYNIKLDN